MKQNVGKWITPIVATCLMIGGCTDERNKAYSYYTEFPQQKELKCQEITLDTAIFRYPFRITIKDSLALIMDLHNITHAMHVFTYPTFQHVASFARKGNADDEMISVERFLFEAPDSVWLIDSRKRKISRWDITPAPHEAPRQVEAISLDADLLRTLDMVRYNDSTYFIPDYSGSSRFCIVNKQGEILQRKGTIPLEEEDPNISRPALAQAWRSFMNYNPTNGVMAIATQLGEVLEIYNFKDDTHYVCYGPHKSPQFETRQKYAIPTGIMGFGDVQVTDKYIYTIFEGRFFKDIIPGKVINDGGQHIYVFSLTGEPVCDYVLDRYINGFYVDESRNKITALDVNRDDPIVEYTF